MRAIETIGTTICGELDCLARGATTLSATIKRQSISGINTIQQEIHKNKVIKTGNFSQLCLVLSRCSTKVVIQKQLSSIAPIFIDSHSLTAPVIFHRFLVYFVTMATCRSLSLSLITSNSKWAVVRASMYLFGCHFLRS